MMRGCEAGASSPSQRRVPSAHDAGTVPSNPARLGMAPATVQPMWPSESATTRFCAGMPERVPISSASDTLPARSISASTRFSASGRCATQARARRRPRSSVSKTGPQIVSSTRSTSSGRPLQRSGSSRTASVAGPAGVR